MPWFNVDDAIADMPEVMRIPRRYRLAAMGLWTLAGGWVSKHLTDGFVPDEVVLELGGTPFLANLLVESGLWTRGLHEGRVGVTYSGRGARVPLSKDVHKTREDSARRVRNHRERQRNPSDQRGSPDVTPLRSEPVTPQPGIHSSSKEPNGSFLLPNQAVTEPHSGSVTSNRYESNAHESNGRVLDGMGRPSMSITAIATGAPERRPEPPPPDHRVSIEVRDAVKAALPARMWRCATKVRVGLELEVARLLDNEAEMDDVATALSAWVGKKAAGEDIYPGHLPHLFAKVVAEQTATPQDIRNGQPMASRDRKFLAAQALKHSNPTRKELT